MDSQTDKLECCAHNGVVSTAVEHRAEMNKDAFEVRPESTEYRYLVQEEGEEEKEEQYVHQRDNVGHFLVVSRRRVFLACLGVLALFTVAGYPANKAQTSAPGLAQVATDCGEYRGTQHANGAYSFKGMRYAAPPTGERRWAPPAAAPCRSDGNVTDATRFGSKCPQVPHPHRETAQEVIGQEDCLFINVWTPSLEDDAKEADSGAGLPVMVFIHGGGLAALSGHEDDYSPSEELAAETGLVYVSFNYRLNALGFMALEVLSQASTTNTSGNYGFMDMIAALQWVQKNIHAFGGDPAKVTIFGQSSGGTAIWAMMMSPLAKGLFRGAVDMSGAYVFEASLQTAQTDNLVFLKKTGCQDLDCLRGLSVQQILQAIPWQEFPSWAADGLEDLPTKDLFYGAVAVVDGRVIPAPPFHMWENGGNFSDVPFVVGTTWQEADVSPPYANISKWTWDDYRSYVTDRLRPFGDELAEQALQRYPSSGPCPTADRCPEFMFTTMVSDMRWTCPSNELAARAAAALRSPVYRYVATHTPSAPRSVPPGVLGGFPSRFSFHLLDVVSFFGQLGSMLKTPLSKEDQDFRQLITRQLVNFAKEGKMLDPWPEYPTGIALLSDSLSVVHNDSSFHCQFWKDRGFYRYATIN